MVVKNIQVLRFVAAALVLIGHTQNELVDEGLLGAEWLPVAWGFGVDVFFVISGFVMYLAAAPHFGTAGALQKFLTRRLLRVVPLYWIFTSLALVAMIIRPGTMNADPSDPFYVISSYLFLPWARPDGAINPLLSLGWTLNYEMLFYVLLAAALFLPKRVGVAFLVAMLVFATLVGRFVPGDWTQLVFWTRPIILEFAAGILLAFVFTKITVRLPFIVGLALAALAIGLAPPSPNPGWRFLDWGLPALALCAAGAFTHEPRLSPAVWRSLLVAGESSYALYLSHPFGIFAAIAVLTRFEFLSFWVVLVVVVTACFAAGVLIYLLVDRPLQDYFRARAGRSSSRVANMEGVS